MMKKSYIFFVLILSNLFGQSYSGIVKDISGEPISYVIIEEINSNLENSNWTMSDDNGGFTINVDKESDILFKRIGFKNITIKPNERLSKYVTMPFDNISLETVDVSLNCTSFSFEASFRVMYSEIIDSLLITAAMCSDL